MAKPMATAKEYNLPTARLHIEDGPLTANSNASGAEQKPTACGASEHGRPRKAPSDIRRRKTVATAPYQSIRSMRPGYLRRAELRSKKCQRSVDADARGTPRLRPAHASLEALPMDDRGARLIVLALGDPICWKVLKDDKMEPPIH